MRPADRRIAAVRPVQSMGQVTRPCPAAGSPNRSTVVAFRHVGSETNRAHGCLPHTGGLAARAPDNYRPTGRRRSEIRSYSSSVAILARLLSLLETID